MEISIKTLAFLKQYMPCGKGELLLEIKPNTLVDNLPGVLGIPKNIGLKILVNGKHYKKATCLSHGDQVTIFPIMDGG